MKHLLLIFGAAALAFLCGCDSLKVDENEEDFDNKGDKANSSIFSKKEPRYVISFHEIIKYPRASDIEKPINTLDGKKVYININQFVHSSDIMDARLIKLPNNENYYNIRLKFSSSGALRWHSMAINFKGREVAMLLDGQYLTSLIAQPLEDDEDEWVVIRGPFDSVTARGIQRNAARNFSIFTPDPNRLF
jgi:preprotein translocase subunit SecD